MRVHRRYCSILCLCLAVVFAAFALSGCLSTYKPPQGTPAPGSGGMGMGGGSGAEDGSAGMAGGVIAKPGSASIELASSQDASNAVSVAKVVAPSNAWVVVRSVLATGPVFGAVKVPQGETTDITIPVVAPDSTKIRVELHVDRGTGDSLDFNPLRPERGADRVVIVNGKPVVQVLTLKNYGVEAASALISLWVEDQKVKNGQLRIKQALTPDDGWIVVRAVENGAPARIVGLTRIKGEVFEANVPLAKGDLPRNVLVILMKDNPKIGVYQFAMRTPFTSVDQPYTLGGAVYSAPARLE